VPITPFHGGIGLACKGPLARRFSFAIFTATQVAIDLESAFFLFSGQYPVHRFFHTFIGASLVCLAVALLARRPCEALLRAVARALGDGRPAWLDLKPTIARSTALWSALAGMLGHVIPDAIMHADARPFAPFSDGNPLLGLTSLAKLHLGLVVLGAVGFGWMLATARARAR
jgi:hypothetical protein